MKSKRGIVWNKLIPWLIAIFFFVLILIFHKEIINWMNSGVDYLKDLIRFG